MKTFKSFFPVLACLVFLSACTETNNNTGPNQITVDGQIAGWQQAGIGWSALIGSDYDITYQSSFIKSSTYPSITLSYGVHTYTTYSQADFFAFFTTGSKTFAVDPSQVGFAVYYNEGASGPSWSSAAGSQSGSSVTFNSLTNQPGSGPVGDRVKYNITVDCKVYNIMTPSDSKAISGTFEGSFEQY